MLGRIGKKPETVSNCYTKGYGGVTQLEQLHITRQEICWLSQFFPVFNVDMI